MCAVGVSTALALWLASAASALASGWSIQPIPEPRVANGNLTDVSCASPRACVAVGSYATIENHQVMLVERWNGSRWLIERTLRPVGATGSRFTEVSCASPAACIAIGSYDTARTSGLTLVERWNGASWSIQQTPSPATGAANSQLTAVSCSSAMACTAVGSYTLAGGQRAVPLVERWDGSGWSVQPTPDLGDAGATLSGVSCSSPTACTAVGAYYRVSGLYYTLAERWDGTRWSLQPLPSYGGTPPGPFGGRAQGGLSDISCSSPTSCAAVGQVSYDGPMLLGHWDGTSWSLEEMNSGATSLSDLASVSCASPSVCAAVGYDIGYGLYNKVPLAVRWDGRGWSVQKTANVGVGIDSTLTGVSCASATACTAVGLSGVTTLAEHWNGARWSFEQTVNPTVATNGDLRGVSCASRTSCTTVGFYSNPAGGGGMLAERWTGTRWSIQPTPSPAGASDTSLSAVSCFLSTACTAVGSDSIGALVERWSGTSWSIQSAPKPYGALAAVSCASMTACIAVANHSDTPIAAPDPGSLSMRVAGADRIGSGLPVAERWDGKRWSIQRFPKPAGATDLGLVAISCATPRACMVVGWYVGTHGRATLVERWDGARWSIQSAPNPTGGLAIGLTGVSCSSSTACTAVGSYYTPAVRTALPLAARWNGTRWSIQQVSKQAGGTDNTLAGVSCTSNGSCTAVGSYYSNAAGHEVTLVERWSGRWWSIQPTATGGFLSGVSCASPSACTAVGAYNTGTTLVERGNGTG